MCACGSDKRVGWQRCCESLNLRNLYEVYVNNGLEYGDESSFTKLIVARNENEAEELVKKTRDYKIHETHNTWIHTEKVDIIDGYKVKLEKIK